ncbi:uncharacterized protein LOC133716324 [Rosa rugosa]|uniref:uncharacterized protein LOC133716324 n=1 Tax=Rosa rugosa TaxID=74645 RepID=UPI002B402376|nr:uncharacterized protein LOC133716324 [Rosa rugosa]
MARRILTITCCCSNCEEFDASTLKTLQQMMTEIKQSKKKQAQETTSQFFIQTRGQKRKIQQGEDEESDKQEEKKRRKVQLPKRKKQKRKIQQDEDEDSDEHEEKKSRKVQLPKRKEQKGKQNSEPKSRIKWKQQKCTLSSFWRIIEMHKSRIPKEALEILRGTVFWAMIQPFFEGKLTEKQLYKHEVDLEVIMKHYNKSNQKFKFGEKEVEITEDDVKVLFGLPTEGIVRDLNMKLSRDEREDWNSTLELELKKDKTDKDPKNGPDPKKIASLIIIHRQHKSVQLAGDDYYFSTGWNPQAHERQAIDSVRLPAFNLLLVPGKDEDQELHSGEGEGKAKTLIKGGPWSDDEELDDFFEEVYEDQETPCFNKRVPQATHQEQEELLRLQGNVREEMEAMLSEETARESLEDKVKRLAQENQQLSKKNRGMMAKLKAADEKIESLEKEKRVLFRKLKRKEHSGKADDGETEAAGTKPDFEHDTKKQQGTNSPSWMQISCMHPAEQLAEEQENLDKLACSIVPFSPEKQQGKQAKFEEGLIRAKIFEVVPISCMEPERMHSIEQNVKFNKRKGATKEKQPDIEFSTPEMLKTETMKSYGKKAKMDKEEPKERKILADEYWLRADFLVQVTKADLRMIIQDQDLETDVIKTYMDILEKDMKKKNIKAGFIGLDASFYAIAHEENESNFKMAGKSYKNHIEIFLVESLWADCGPFLLHFMESLANGEEPTKQKGDEMRKTILERFITLEGPFSNCKQS